jgi:hypothetical protein
MLSEWEEAWKQVPTRSLYLMVFLVGILSWASWDPEERNHSGHTYISDPQNELVNNGVLLSLCMIIQNPEIKQKDDCMSFQCYF